jgi:hypothetical protein
MNADFFGNVFVQEAALGKPNGNFAFLFLGSGMELTGVFFIHSPIIPNLFDCRVNSEPFGRLDEERMKAVDRALLLVVGVI